MKTIWRLCLLGLALADWGYGLWAVEPPSARTTGKVLVLDNGNILEGNIVLCGDQFRIQRAVGEMWVPVAKGMRLCADWQEVFAFMSGQANLLDPDEHMRLARWCQLHNLREQALAEVAAVLTFQPSNQEAKHLKAALERDLAEKTTAHSVAAGEKSTPAPFPKMDISSGSMALFATRVQPILMNTCVSCHSGGKGGHFQLVRSSSGGQRVATQRNLAAVLEQIDVHRPNVSPLLIRSVSAHGLGKMPPLKSHSPAFDNLEAWVMQLLADNPQLKTEPASPALAIGTVPQPRSTPLWNGPKTPTPKTPRTVPSYASQPEPTSPALENRPMPKFIMATNAPTVRNMASPNAAQAVPAKHTWSVENKTPPPETNQAPSGVVQTSFSEQGSVTATEPVDEFDPAYFNQQTIKETTGPGR
jgi:hypothetical protein